MGIVLSDADGTLFPAILGSNVHYTDEMRKNLARIYEELPALPWALHNIGMLRDRVFVLHTGREPQFNDITRVSVFRLFGIEHFRIVNVPFAGSHQNYIKNKVNALVELIDHWLSNREQNESIRVIDDDPKVINPVFSEYGKGYNLYFYTVIENELIML
jgi:hypothetical protein